MPEIRELEAEERLKEVAERAEEMAKKFGTAIEKGVEKLAEKDIPRFTRNAIVLATGAMTVYTMGTALATMLPAAQGAFYQMGAFLGYLIPLMFQVMVISATIGIVKLLIR